MHTPQSEPGTSICSNCLFDQPWWLDAVAPQQWSEIAIRSGDELVARWPFLRKKVYGFTYLTRPPCTPILGPAVVTGDGKFATRLAREAELLTQLADELPPFDYMAQPCHYSVSTWLPLYWKGWSQTTRYTYVLDDLTDEEKVWSGFRDNARREIRKAEKSLVVRDDLGIDAVLGVQQMTYARQGRRLPDNSQVLHQLESACRARNAGKAFAAVDAEERIHAAIYVVWDDRSAYYLLGGGDPDLRNSGAHSLVMWAAIRFAASVTRRFDFEGSMVQAIERFFRAFGGRPVPYSKVSRAKSRCVRTLMALRAGQAA